MGRYRANQERQRTERQQRISDARTTKDILDEMLVDIQHTGFASDGERDSGIEALFGGSESAAYQLWKELHPDSNWLYDTPEGQDRLRSVQQSNYGSRAFQERLEWFNSNSQHALPEHRMAIEQWLGDVERAHSSGAGYFSTDVVDSAFSSMREIAAQAHREIRLPEISAAAGQDWASFVRDTLRGVRSSNSDRETQLRIGIWEEVQDSIAHNLRVLQEQRNESARQPSPLLPPPQEGLEYGVLGELRLTASSNLPENNLDIPVLLRERGANSALHDEIAEQLRAVLGHEPTEND